MATDITINDLTTASSVTDGVSDGTGVFDNLMDSVNRYLIDDYDAGRSIGTDYATIKAAAITAVLQQSMQFALTQEQSEKQTALIEEQTLAQTAATIREDLLASKQAANADKDLEVKEQNRLQSVAQTTEVESSTIRNDLAASKDAVLKDQQVANLTAEALNIPKQGNAVDSSIIREDLLASKNATLLDASKIKEEWVQRQIEAGIKRDKGYTTATSTTL